MNIIRQCHHWSPIGGQSIVYRRIGPRRIEPQKASQIGCPLRGLGFGMTDQKTNLLYPTGSSFGKPPKMVFAFVLCCICHVCISRGPARCHSIALAGHKRIPNNPALPCALGVLARVLAECSSTSTSISKCCACTSRQLGVQISPGEELMSSCCGGGVLAG